MKIIALSRGHLAQVSDRDYPRLRCFRWRAIKNNQLWYAVRYARVDGKQVSISMHREILGLVRGDGIEADHRDGNGLNNQRRNLRKATRGQNAKNRRISKNSTSGFKGVYRNKTRWEAHIKVDGKMLYLGSFGSPEEANRDYVRAAKKHFGRFARKEEK